MSKKDLTDEDTLAWAEIRRVLKNGEEIDSNHRLLLWEALIKGELSIMIDQEYECRSCKINPSLLSDFEDDVKTFFEEVKEDADI